MKARIDSLVLGACVSLTLGLLSGCATTESHRVIESQTVATYKKPYSGIKTALVVGNFGNRSNYMQGLFSNNTNQLGNQAKTILKTHLQQTQRFKLLDRENLSQIQQEAKLRGQKQKLAGARYAVTGAVTEFGRKEEGDKQLFGLVGSGKSQIAYSKVSISIVDVLSSEVIYSTQGAGEYRLTQREVMGFGSNTGYDSTLNGKVLNFAIINAVDNLVKDLENGTLNVSQ